MQHEQVSIHTPPDSESASPGLRLLGVAMSSSTTTTTPAGMEAILEADYADDNGKIDFRALRQAMIQRKAATEQEASHPQPRMEASDAHHHEHSTSRSPSPIPLTPPHSPSKIQLACVQAAQAAAKSAKEAAQAAREAAQATYSSIEAVQLSARAAHASAVAADSASKAAQAAAESANAAMEAEVARARTTRQQRETAITASKEAEPMASTEQSDARRDADKATSPAHDDMVVSPLHKGNMLGLEIVEDVESTSDSSPTSETVLSKQENIDQLDELRAAVTAALTPSVPTSMSPAFGTTTLPRQSVEYPHYHGRAPETPAPSSPPTKSVHTAPAELLVAANAGLFVPPSPLPYASSSSDTSSNDGDSTPITTPSAMGRTVTHKALPIGMEGTHVEVPLTQVAEVASAVFEVKQPAASSPTGKQAAKQSRVDPIADVEVELLEYAESAFSDETLCSSSDGRESMSIARAATARTLEQAKAAGIPLQAAAAAASGELTATAAQRIAKQSKETLGWRGLRPARQFLAPCDMRRDELVAYLSHYTSPYAGPQNDDKPYRGVIRPRRWHTQRKRSLPVLEAELAKLHQRRVNVLGRVGLAADASWSEIDDINNEVLSNEIGRIDQHISARTDQVKDIKEDIAEEQIPSALAVPKNKAVFTRHESDDRLWQDLTSVNPTIRRWSQGGQPYDLDRKILSPVMSECTEAPTISRSSSVSHLSLVSGRSDGSASSLRAKGILQTLTESGVAQEPVQKVTVYTAAPPSRQLSPRLDSVSKSRASTPPPTAASPQQTSPKRNPRLSVDTSAPTDDKTSRHTSWTSSTSGGPPVSSAESVTQPPTPRSNTSHASLPSSPRVIDLSTRQPTSPTRSERSEGGHRKPPVAGRIRAQAAASMYIGDERFAKLSPATELLSPSPEIVATKRLAVQKIASLSEIKAKAEAETSTKAALPARAAPVAGKRKSQDVLAAKAAGERPLLKAEPQQQFTSPVSPTPKPEGSPSGDIKVTRTRSNPGRKREKPAKPSPEKLAAREQKSASKSARWRAQYANLQAKQDFNERREQLSIEMQQTKDEATRSHVTWRLAELYFSHGELLGSPAYIAAAKVMQDGLNHYKTLQNDPERWTDLARVHFLLDTVMPPSDKHLHIGLDCVQSAVKLAGEESELAGDAWMMAAQAATTAEHLERHNQYAHAYLQRALKCQAGQRQHERYLHFAHVCNMIVHDVRAGKAEGDAMEWRKQCIDAMKRAVELSPTEPYRQRLAYFRRCRDAEVRGAEDNSIPFSSSEGEGR